MQTRTCEECGEEFEPYRSWQRFCSPLHRERAGDRRRGKTPGTYQYNTNRGIGEAGEKKRNRNREYARTPGTNAYNREHGIGKAGEKKRLAVQRWREKHPERVYAYNVKGNINRKRKKLYEDIERSGFSVEEISQEAARIRSGKIQPSATL